MIFRIEADGQVTLTVQRGSVRFTHPSGDFALLNSVLADASALLSNNAWSFLHIEGDEFLALAHAGIPVLDVAKDADVLSLFSAISDVAGSVTPRILEQPAITDTQVAEQNTQPEKVNGEWVLGWTVRDKTAEELAQEETNRRQAMTVERWSFATAAMAAGILTAEEAQAWGPGTSLPAAVDQAITAAVSDPVQLAGAKVRALSAPRINRLNPLVEILRGAFQLTEEQADDLFAVAKQIEAGE